VRTSYQIINSHEQNTKLKRYGLKIKIIINYKNNTV